MIGKLLSQYRQLKEMQDDTRRHRVATFNDPIATRTSWKPMRSGGNNIRSYTLVRHGADRLEFRSKLIMKCIAACAIAVGAWVVWSRDLRFESSEEFRSMFTLIDLLGTLAGCAILVFGIGKLLTAVRPIYFDRASRTCRVFRRFSAKRVPFAQIQGLQLLQKDLEDHTSYELNLVLKDAGRMHILDDGSREALRNDATALGKFIGVPIWDVTGIPDEAFEAFDAAFNE